MNISAVHYPQFHSNLHGYYPNTASWVPVDFQGHFGNSKNNSIHETIEVPDPVFTRFNFLSYFDELALIAKKCPTLRFMKNFSMNKTGYLGHCVMGLLSFIQKI